MSDIRFIKIEPLPKPDKRPSRLSALLLWAIAAAGLILTSIVMGLLDSALAGLNTQAYLLVTNAVYYLPFVVLPVFVLAKRNPGLYEAYRPNPISLFNVICTVVLAVLGVFMVNDLTVLWAIPLQKLGLDIYAGGVPVPANTQELVLAVITMAAMPAICEEFMLRGAVMPAFEKYGTKHAFIVTALLFGTLHGSIVGLPAQFILGLILCALVFWTDSVYAGLIYHTVHNASILILEYLQNQAPADPAESADLLTAIGGMAGVLDLALSILISGALLIFSLRMFKLRGRLEGVTIEKREKLPLKGREIIVLVIGLLMCALLYATDIFVMLGGIAA